MFDKHSRKIRYGIVGAGNIAQVAVLPSFVHAENSELAAIFSSDSAKRNELKKRYELEHCGTYEELEEIAAKASLDAVYIALPNHLHREFTERAARLGLHVLCEKPMAATVEDCEAMIRVARENDVKLMIAYRLHFEEANLAAIQILRSGRIGDPLICSAFLTQQVRPEDIRTKADVGGGALLDTGIYCINAARYLFGEEPTKVFCYSNMNQDERFHDVDATSLGTLRFPNGKMAQIGTSQAAAGISNFQVIGTKGDLRLDPAFSYKTERRYLLTVKGKTEERTFPK